jgi:hypothetical protein
MWLLAQSWSGKNRTELRVEYGVRGTGCGVWCVGGGVWGVGCGHRQSARRSRWIACDGQFGFHTYGTSEDDSFHNAFQYERLVSAVFDTALQPRRTWFEPWLILANLLEFFTVLFRYFKPKVKNLIHRWKKERKQIKKAEKRETKRYL